MMSHASGSRVFAAVSGGLVAWWLALAAPAEAQSRTWQHMPTGNGHGFQVFDRDRHRITTFLEHPYSFVAPGAPDRTWGVQRRDLAHDIYFGVRAGGTTTWLHDQTEIEYEAQSHIIHGTSTQNGVQTDTYYFGPFGYEGNAMVMLIRARNAGSAAASVSLYAKPNMLLGGQAGGVRAERGSDGEQIRWNPSATPPHATETGPGGGRAIYVPIGDVTAVSCGGDMAMYDAVRTSGNVGSTAMCNGTNQVPVFQRDVMLDAGAEAWWGVAVLFLNDNPNEPQAADFRDMRTTDEILALWGEFAAGRDAQAIHDDALAELEAWRIPETMPPGLSDRERALWRQSEVVMRLGQIREENQPNRENHGMVLASLPPGSWHIGWVRDGAYGIASHAMTGHYEEARMGLEFLLGADGATGGFFSSSAHLGAPYRVSATRYFGNGKEEGDFNSDGPNVETDGWGLVLWAAGLYLYYRCDFGWLDTTTWRGDSVWDALLEVASDIEEQIMGDLPKADTSIWEVHWNRRQVFTYTAATQIRGLYDFAAIATYRGETDVAEHYRGIADRMLEATRSRLVYSSTRSLASHLGVAASPVHVDGSTVEMLAWGLIEPSDPIYMGTLNGYSKLITGFGGYQRLEPMLSLTGEGSAGPYDTSEWVLLDLRIGQAWRYGGRPDLADTLLDKVTNNSAVNDNLVAELYDRSSGAYTGAIPMVGYGAGAWMMTQLDKHGAPAPGPGPDFLHCDEPRPDGGIFVPGDGGFRPPTDGGVARGDGGPVTFTDDAACLCTTPGARGSDGAGGALAAFALVLLLVLRRRAGRVVPLLAVLAITALASRASAQDAGVAPPAPPEDDSADLEREPEPAPDEAQSPWWRRGGQGVEPADTQPEAAPARTAALPDADAEPAETAAPDAANAPVAVPAEDVGASGRVPDATQDVAWPGRLTVERPVFGEDEHADDISDEWQLTFHGYARMPLAWYGAAQRPAYLVDSDYFLSGFNYTRVAEREWAEIFLGAQRNRTRFVVGLFASQFSDWSETSIQGQGGIATAFVEHTEPLGPELDVGVRAGMFWDRYGYLPRYDTYLFGRTHIAGVRLSGRLFDRFYLRTGFGAHADVVSSNQGFTPTVWASLGVDLEWLDVGLHAFEVWTNDSEREFAIIENGSLTVLGADAHVALDAIGRLYLGVAHYDADQVLFLANTLELLHSTGGRGLTENFFGLDSRNGTGSVVAAAFELAWEPGRTLAAVSGADAAQMLRGLELRLFALTAHVKSEQSSPDPLTNRDDRTYFKWGGELFWRPRFGSFDAVYGAVRYDRVVLDTDHDSMTYRVISPRVGVTPMAGLDLFLQYSRYAYGDNVSLRPNQIPGDNSVTEPDNHAFKLQAEVAW